MNAEQEFTRRIAEIHGLGKQKVHSERAEVTMDIRHAELKALFDSFLGRDYDGKKFDRVEALQRAQDERQATLVSRYNNGAISFQEYTNLLNSSMEETLLSIEQLLGPDDFARLFGMTRESFLKSVDDPSGREFNHGKIRILIADDHEVVRCGLKTLLANTDVEIVAEVATGEAAIRYALDEDPDVVVLDIRMPEGDGLTALGRIKLEKPDMPVLMLSTFDNPTYIARAVALGASGYVLKGCTKDQLLEAIRTAASGGSAWTRDELRRVTGALATPRLAADVEVLLTQRESEVLRQLAYGLTNKEIAQAMYISYETVKEHVQHILQKIGVSDRTQAAVWAIRKELE